jgi:CheY-like chemotaxis protein
MVVDDDAVAGTLARRSLGELGYAVDVVRDPNEALGRLLQEAPDLLVVDLQLPGMDGNTLVQLVKRTPNLGDLRVFGCSAVYEGESGPVKLLRSSGADGFLPKPLVAPRLRRALAPDASRATRWPLPGVADVPVAAPATSSLKRAFSASTPDFADELLAEADAIPDWQDAQIVSEAVHQSRRRRRSRSRPGAAVSRPGARLQPPVSKARVWTAPGVEVPDGYAKAPPPAERKVLDLNRETGKAGTRRVRKSQAAVLNTATFQGFAMADELPGVVQWKDLRSNCVVEKANPDQLVLRVLGEESPARAERVEIGVRFPVPGEARPVKLKMTGTVTWVADRGEHKGLLIALGITGNADHFEALCATVGD